MRGHNEDIYCQALPLHVFGNSENDVVEVTKQNLFECLSWKIDNRHSLKYSRMLLCSITDLSMRLDVTSAKPWTLSPSEESGGRKYIYNPASTTTTTTNLPSQSNNFLFSCRRGGDSWANTNPYLSPFGPPYNPSVGPPVQVAHLPSQATGPYAHPSQWKQCGGAQEFTGSQNFGQITAGQSAQGAWSPSLNWTFSLSFPFDTWIPLSINIYISGQILWELDWNHCK